MRRRYSIVIAPIATHFILTTKRNNLVFQVSASTPRNRLHYAMGSRDGLSRTTSLAKVMDRFIRTVFSSSVAEGIRIRVLERNYLGLRRHLRYGRNGTPCSYHNILEVSASTPRNRLHYAMGARNP